MRHVIHPEADAEFAEAVRYYGSIESALGVRYFHEIERLIREMSG